MKPTPFAPAVDRFLSQAAKLTAHQWLTIYQRYVESPAILKAGRVAPMLVDYAPTLQVQIGNTEILAFERLIVLSVRTADGSNASFIHETVVDEATVVIHRMCNEPDLTPGS